jgi:acetyl/propionyl-CoA carboxylase alpha subunit
MEMKKKLNSDKSNPGQVSRETASNESSDVTSKSVPPQENIAVKLLRAKAAAAASKEAPRHEEFPATVNQDLQNSNELTSAEEKQTDLSVSNKGEDSTVSPQENITTKLLRAKAAAAATNQTSNAAEEKQTELAISNTSEEPKKTSTKSSALIPSKVILKRK